MESTNQERGKDRPRVLVFRRIDLFSLDREASADRLDEISEQLETIVREPFSDVASAEAFHLKHLDTHLPPLYESTIRGCGGPHFLGPRLAEYQARPAGDLIETAIDFVLQSPIRCSLAADWEFEEIRLELNGRVHSKAVGRHPQHPDRELLEYVSVLEANVYRRHTGLSAEVVGDLWSSFEFHRLLTLHAIRMQRYFPHYEGSVGAALAYLRAHIMNYVQAILLQPVEPPRKSSRQLQIDRLLLNRGWGFDQWVRAAEVDRTTAYRFYHHQNKPRRLTQMSLAKALGIAAEDWL